MQTTGITNLPTQPPSQGLAAEAAVGAAKQESSQPEPQLPTGVSVSELEAEVRQVDTPSPANGTSGTIVSEGFVFTETQYEPTADVTGEDLSKLSQDDLLTGLKKQFINARKSHGQFGRDLSALVLFYDQVVKHCKIQGVGGEGRKGVPTLHEAFFAIGWNYEASRKMKQRCNASLNALPAYAASPKPLLLREADLVTEEGKDGVFTVVNVHAPSQLKRPNEPIASRPLGGPPKWLSPEEKVVWRDVAKQVLPGVVYNSDRNTFELLVRLITKMRAGQMDKSSDMCQMVSLYARFGMTPSDRAKISVEAPKESALTKFLARHTPSAPKLQ